MLSPTLKLPSPTASAIGGRIAGTVALTGMATTLSIVVVGAASHASPLVPARKGGFPEWLRGFFSGLDVPLSLHAFVVLALAMCAFYLLVLSFAGRISARAAIVAIVAMHLVLFLGPVLLSTDVFNYISYSRMQALHGINPYSHPPSVLPHDSTYPFLGWRDSISVYGPLYTIINYPLGFVGVATALWLTKLVTMAASLGAIAFVWATARRLGRSPVQAALFVGLNPVLLLFGVGGAHNDSIVMMLTCFGLYLTASRRGGGGALAIASATAMKLSSGLLLPFCVIGSHDRRRAIVAAIAGLAAVAALALLAFGSHAFDFVGVLRWQQGFGSLHSVPKEVTTLFGFGGDVQSLRPLLVGLFIVAFGAMLLRARTTGDWITAAGWATFALLVTTMWLLPWYVMWLLPIAALSASRPLRAATLGLTVFVLMLRLALWI